MPLRQFTTDNIEEYRLPVNGTYKSQKIRGMAVLVPDINRNEQMLHDFIYGKDAETVTNAEADKK